MVLYNRNVKIRQNIPGFVARGGAGEDAVERKCDAPRVLDAASAKLEDVSFRARFAGDRFILCVQKKQTFRFAGAQTNVVKPNLDYSVCQSRGYFPCG